MAKKDLSVTFCGVKFPNPFVLAASPVSDELEMVSRAFEMGWGGAVLKTTSVITESVRLVYPMMVGIDMGGSKLAALQNIDLISEYHIDEIEKRIQYLKKHYPNHVVIASMMGNTKEEWQELVRRVEEAGADMIECSFSCPHGMPEKGMGATIGQNPDLVRRTAGWVKEAAKKIPIVIKLTPQIAEISTAAQAVKEAGCEGVCAINTVKSITGIDLDTLIPYPNVHGFSTYGGMCGPAVKPITLRCIAEIAKKVDIEITGSGGASNWKDAVEFLLLGASNVQVCTAIMHYGYRVIDDFTEGLSHFMEEKGFNSVEDIIGKSLPFITDHAKLPDVKVVSNINPDLCIKCDVCHISCRDGGHQAILVDESRLPHVDEKKCVGCGFCKTICPVPGCISLKEV